MKRNMMTLLAAILVIFSCVFPVHAAANRLVEDADLLTQSEERQVRELLDEVSAHYGLDVVVVTTDSTGDRSPREYADDYFDYNGYGEDGILLLVSMEDRDWWIFTTGYGIVAFTDAGLGYMEDRIVPKLSDGDYVGAFESFGTLCVDFLDQAKTGEPYDNFNLPRSPFQAGKVLFISLFVGAFVAAIVVGIMRGQLKSVRRKANAHYYLVPGSLNIHYSRDFHLYTTRQRRAKPKSSSGSSTHRSSSGRSHGGRGGKF